MYVGGQWCVFDCLQFVSAWQDTLFCESEAKAGNFFAAEEAFLLVDFDAVLDQALQNLVQSSDVFWVSGGVYQKDVNVHNYIGQSVGHSFHQALKTGWASQQAHGAGDPLELAHARHSKKIVLPDRPISPMHSLTSFIEYLSV